MHSFILRLWLEPGDEGQGASRWRLSLEDSRMRARRGFGSLEEFFTYLENYCRDVDGER